MNLIDDGFDRYYSEKLWEMIPEYYRNEDGLSDRPDVLRSIIEIIASQVAVVRRSHDALWNDQYIELCDQWAVPYIGDLLATRLLSSSNERGQRVDVAKTIYYRRRKGTLGVLEELISDISGWEGNVTEYYQHLARLYHGLEAAPVESRFTKTPKGGTANLRSLQGAQLLNSDFNEYSHTPEFRRHNGSLGKLNIQKLGINLYRIRAYAINGGQPFKLDDNRFCFDPSGRNTQLMQMRSRDNNYNNWVEANPWEVMAPMSCHLFNHCNFNITAAVANVLRIEDGVSDGALVRLLKRIPNKVFSESDLTQLVAQLNEPELQNEATRLTLFNYGLAENCGRSGLYPKSVSINYDDMITSAEVAAADLNDWPRSIPNRALLFDPEKGRIEVNGLSDEFTVNYFYGTCAPIGAGSYQRDLPPLLVKTNVTGGGALSASEINNEGASEIQDNLSYRPLSDKLSVRDLTLRAKNGCRPYITMETNWVLRCTDGETDAKILLDGLWIGSSDNDNEIIIRGDGDYESVLIRHCTLDPGGSRDIAEQIIWPVRLVIENKVEYLKIERSIVGQIILRGNGLIEHLEVIDSIVDVRSHLNLWEQSEIEPAPEPSHSIAINLPSSTVTLSGVTVFGEVNVNRLWCSNSIITEMVDVSDTQDGCFRFSAAVAGSRVPRAYHSYEIDPTRYEQSKGLFTSTSFGHIGYGQLSQIAPKEVSQGGEDKSEMGAFNFEKAPYKRKDLEKKINEYIPFGLIPLFTYET